ncbi:ThiF family adenylyltransferase [Pseudomonas syringae]|uniref:ThiF family adenylyltransferase n=1 Tax=Pseudomonas syringae TaxID=317 RepID=UPI00040CB1F0|nr:ThiF family adenylyltransferase [Pseudomonas syringae]
MLNPKQELTPYEHAAEAIKQWLDGLGAEFAARSKKHHRLRKMDAWDIELPHPIGVQTVQLSISPDFPVTPPEVHLDRALCLAWPHVEETGRFCHGVESAAEDYENPKAVFEEVLQRLSEFWLLTQDPLWIENEFHNERLSYWHRFCNRHREVTGSAPPKLARVQFHPIEKPTGGLLAAYFSHSKKLASDLILTTVGESDPHAVAVRHKWSKGSLVKGHSLFLPISEAHRWTPFSWPGNFADLAHLVGQLTGESSYLEEWINGKAEKKKQMFLVVLVQSNVSYGYLITPPVVNRLTIPGVIPVALDRVDADWMLARDHQLPVLHKRRSSRVLLLGCGSLGSSVAELLARAGVGELHLVDKELLEPENCARHLLGADSVDLGKASQLASELRRKIPGLSVRAFWAMIGDWVPATCRPGQYDLVVDCSGESSIRSMLSRFRTRCFGDAAMAHAWMEPFCAAAHVVHVGAVDSWPANDPYEKVNVAHWNQTGAVSLPACGSGFHPYGSADAWQAAGFVVERLLSVLDDQVTVSTVWSWIRSSAFFDALGVDVRQGPLIPVSPYTFDAVQKTRTLGEVLGVA